MWLFIVPSNALEYPHFPFCLHMRFGSEIQSQVGGFSFRVENQKIFEFVYPISYHHHGINVWFMMADFITFQFSFSPISPSSFVCRFHVGNCLLLCFCAAFQLSHTLFSIVHVTSWISRWEVCPHVVVYIHFYLFEDGNGTKVTKMMCEWNDEGFALCLLFE